MATTIRQRATEVDKSRHARGLTAAQLAAVELVVVGKGDGEVGEAVGVSRQTICAWRNWHAEFRACLNTRRREVFGQAADRLRALAGRALEVLAADLEDAEAFPEARAKAAETVLKLCGPALASQVTAFGPQDAEAVLAEAAKDRTEDVLQMMADGFSAAGVDQVRQEWAAKLSEVEEDSAPDPERGGDPSPPTGPPAPPALEPAREGRPRPPATPPGRPARVNGTAPAVLGRAADWIDL